MLRVLILVLLLVAPILPVYSAENYNLSNGRSFSGEELFEMRQAGKFKKLELIASDLRENKIAFSGGAWSIHFLYYAISDSAWHRGNDPEAEFNEAIKPWRESHPDSITWRILTAKFYQDMAWDHRGSGFSSTVTQDGIKKFYQYLQKEWEMLIEAERLPIDDPEIYVRAYEVAMHYGSSDQGRDYMIRSANGAFGLVEEAEDYDVAERIFETGVNYEPLYYQLYYQRSRSFQYRWGGKSGDLEAFVGASADRTKAFIGEAMYARLYWYTRQQVGSPMAREFYDFDWERIHQGHLDQIVSTPTSLFWRHHLAYCAGLYENKTLVKEILADLPDFYSAVWFNKDRWSRWKNWAFDDGVYPVGGPLEVAAVFSNNEQIAALLKSGEDPSRQNEQRRDPLSITVKNMNWEGASLLLDAGADVKMSWAGINAMRDPSGEMMQFLLENGFNPRWRNPHGRGMIQICAEQGSVAAMKQLLEVNPRVNDVAKDGYTPLIAAARNGHVNMVELLIERGADINHKTKNGHNAASEAAVRGHLEIVKILQNARKAQRRKLK